MDKLILVTVTVFALCLYAVLYQTNEACEAQHGRLVRGIVWFVCVEAK